MIENDEKRPCHMVPIKYFCIPEVIEEEKREGSRIRIRCYWRYNQYREE